MNTAARLIDYGPIAPSGLWALSTVIQERMEKHGGPPTLVLCSPRRPLAGLGYWQAMDEVNLHEARRAGVAVVRRWKGGGWGTIHYPQGALYETLLLPRAHARRLRIHTDRDMLRAMGRAHIETFRQLGVKARHRPLNDIETPRGQKLLGYGVRRGRGLWAATGGYYPTLDRTLAGRIITPPPEKFAGKKYKSVQERVTTLQDELGYAPDPREIRRAMIKGVEKTFGLRLERDITTWGEERALQKQIEYYRSPSYIHRTSDRAKLGKDHKRWPRGDAAHKGEKLVRATVLLDRDGTLRRVRITGDFNARPHDIIDRMEKALRGAAPGEIRAHVAREAARGTLLGVEAGQIAHVVELAAQNAAQDTRR